MRFLFLSNFYPPHSNGGYEQLCQEVAQAFTERGHEVSVITARVGSKQSLDLDEMVHVHRCLELEVEGGLADTVLKLFSRRAASERRNINAVEKIIDEYKPDAALIWGMWNVPKSVPATVERLLPDNTAYYFCDYWPTLPDAYIQRLQEPARRKIASVPKKLLSQVFLRLLMNKPPTHLEFKHPACVSYAVRDQLSKNGIPIGQAEIIHNGICIEDFDEKMRKGKPFNEPIGLVYMGRISPEKGVQTAIIAVRILPKFTRCPIKLQIIGAGHPDYIIQLKELVVLEKLPVQFRGFVPRSGIPDLLAQEQILLFPSEWNEPLARTVIEAMATGLPVVGTTTGGSGELLIDGETGLTFEPGDAEGLAIQIARLIENEDLRAHLVTNAREIVVRDFNIERTIENLENLLLAIAEKSDLCVA